MQALLRRIGIDRDEVRVLGEASGHGRERYVSEAMRPAAATDLWRQLAGADIPSPAALATLSVVEAANAEEEALAVAIALREALETPHKTAALVTPDRALARRVLAALARWAVAVDDSGGDALADTPAGTFARLAAQTALGALAPVDLLALLKHPCTRLAARSARRCSIGAGGLAGAASHSPGRTGLAHALTTLREQLSRLERGERSELHRSDPRTDLREWELEAAADLVVRLAAALAPLEKIGKEPRPFAELAQLHCEVVAALSREKNGDAAAFAGSDGVGFTRRSTRSHGRLPVPASRWRHPTMPSCSRR